MEQQQPPTYEDMMILFACLRNAKETPIRDQWETFQANASSWASMVQPMAERCRELQFNETRTRELEGRMEDMASGPDFDPREHDMVKIRVSRRDTIMAYVQDVVWFTSQKHWHATWQAECGPSETNQQNFQSRLEVLASVLEPLYAHWVAWESRLTNLNKSVTTDTEMVTTLLQECHDILDKEEETQNQAEAGRSWQIPRELAPPTDARTPRLPREGTTSSPTAGLGLPFGDGSPIAIGPRSPFHRTPSASAETTMGYHKEGVQPPWVTTMVNPVSLRVLNSLTEGPVRDFVNEAGRLATGMTPQDIQKFLTKDVITIMDLMALTDSDYSNWRALNRDGLVELFERKILTGKTYAQSFEELLRKVTISMDPTNIKGPNLFAAWKELFELMTRYAENFAQAEGNREQWKKLWQLFLTMLEKGSCRPQQSGHVVQGTKAIRAAVATTLRARCQLPTHDERCVKTAKQFWVETVKAVVSFQEIFSAHREVYMELAAAQAHMSKDDHHMPAQDNHLHPNKRNRSEGLPKGALTGQGASGHHTTQGVSAGERVHCPCGTTRGSAGTMGCLRPVYRTKVGGHRSPRSS